MSVRVFMVRPMDDLGDAVKREFERIVAAVQQRTTGKPVKDVLNAFEDEGVTDDGDLLEVAEAISRGDEPKLIWRN